MVGFGRLVRMSAKPPHAHDSSHDPGSSHEPGSVSLLIQAYKEAGDLEAFATLWQRYIKRLLEVAQKELGGIPRRVANEDDIAQAVFASLHDAVQKGQYPDLNDRGDLWQILLNLAERKAIDWKRYLGRDRRDFRRTVGESAADFAMSNQIQAGAGIANIACPEPTPEVVAELRDQINHLMAALPEDQRRVALHKLQSFTNEEIAEQTECVPRTVERKLQLIRTTWSKLLETDPTSIG